MSNRTVALPMGEQLGLTGLPDAPEQQPLPGRAAVARKSSAEGRPLRLVRPDQHPPTGTEQPHRAIRWLHIVAPPSYSATPSARTWCACGYDRKATGRAGVLALIEAHTDHPEHCPLLGNTEGSKAA
ncbi:hypothetical protein [Streptomyces sp. NBC_00154]|uniref:hypothetical protein n=1 Tax=Streptomyces sp. NBC_00154 TaxID=2975670 RepID=UPI002257A38F|nr:hypothetical protein [Streptomyces sp. NBC_00154]MCX5310367.1 hypothetical protein [Streptomyces sp. NBC_00154]